MELNAKEEDQYDTLHGIASKAFPKKQRDPRIAGFLDGMVINGLIERKKLKDKTFYRVTGKGSDIYKSKFKFTQGVINSIIQKELRDEMIPE